MIYSTELRSYLRADSLPRYEAGGGLGSGKWRGDDHFVWSDDLTNDAHNTTWEGDEYSCPRHVRLRMLEGLLAFNNAFPDAGLIPKQLLVDAGGRLEEMRNQSPTMRSYILTSPWFVPVRWFASFLHEERELYERPQGLSIRYRTQMSDAQQRVERAVQTVSAAGFDPGIVGQVKSLASWIDAFPGDAMLELDYCSVADLFPDGDLVLDESAADVAASLLALEHGDLEGAGEHYNQLMRRWGRVQSLAFAN